MDEYITDSDKFISIITKYHDVFVDQSTFAQRTGISKQTVNNWYKRKTKIINAQARIKISEMFGLQHTIWQDKFTNEIYFINDLPKYKKITKEIDPAEAKAVRLDMKMLGETQNATASEKDTLRRLTAQPHIELDRIDISASTPEFLFELSKMLKENNQVPDALTVIDAILQSKSTFGYVHHNELEHIRAVLLSHKMVGKWDEAIDTLRLLYSASQYHLVEPEIITLMASNYKRKALYLDDGFSLRTKSEVDMWLLSNAYTLYCDAYDLKPKHSRYYDAVNMAYLAKMIGDLDPDSDTSLDIINLYNTLTASWRPADDNWWEVSSEAEILMLSGRVELAISQIDLFLESGYHIDRFDIEATLRQLELYLHFVDDEDGAKFYEYLNQTWQYIREGRDGKQ